MKNKIFIYVFFIICLIPLLTAGINRNDAANEVLKESPSLIKDSKLNVNYLNELSDFFDDHIGLRNEMISIEHKLISLVFGESSEDKVIAGKDGWLFYKETLDDYQNTNTFSPREKYAVEKTLSMMDEYCRKNGIEFVFTVVPNKNTVYPEKMPWYYSKGNEKSSLEILDFSKINYVDLKTKFKNEDKTLYRKSDSHWTNECAGLASDEILRALNKQVTRFYGRDTSVVSAPTGDLFEMLYPSFTDSDTDVMYDIEFNFTYDKPIRSAEDNFIKTSCAGKSGKLYMFRDSFGNTLYPYLAENFENSTFTRMNPYNLTLPVNEKATVVIVEIVERNLNWLLTKPIIFPAPEMKKDLALFDKTDNVLLNINKSDEITDYLKVSGEFDYLPEANENIYIKSENKIYEATLTGDNSFTAFIPAMLSDIQILTDKGDI